MARLQGQGGRGGLVTLLIVLIVLVVLAALYFLWLAPTYNLPGGNVFSIALLSLPV